MSPTAYVEFPVPPKAAEIVDVAETAPSSPCNTPSRDARYVVPETVSAVVEA